jgi:hypothetical protein
VLTHWGLGHVVGNGSYAMLTAKVIMTMPAALAVFLLCFSREERIGLAAGLQDLRPAPTVS